MSAFASSRRLLPPTVTQEQFNSFHQIDRTLFICFVINLGYEPATATDIMALLLWLEIHGYNFTLVKAILNLPIQVILFVTHECSMIWQSLDNDIFPSHLEGDNGVIPLIQNLTGSAIDLHYIHENRREIIPTVIRGKKEVCLRAFSDIVFSPAPYIGVLHNTNTSSTMNPTRTRMRTRTRTVHSGIAGPGSGVIMAPPSSSSQAHIVPTVRHGEDAFQSHMRNLNSEMVRFVHPDERSIFITFCIGFSVSEFELGDFITRNFGNIIEAILMREGSVRADQQALYARVVVHREELIGLVLGGNQKVKFIINGKHVWARKYSTLWKP